MANVIDSIPNQQGNIIISNSNVIRPDGFYYDSEPQLIERVVNFIKRWIAEQNESGEKIVWGLSDEDIRRLAYLLNLQFTIKPYFYDADAVANLPHVSYVASNNINWVQPASPTPVTLSISNNISGEFIKIGNLQGMTFVVPVEPKE